MSLENFLVWLDKEIYDNATCTHAACSMNEGFSEEQRARELTELRRKLVKEVKPVAELEKELANTKQYLHNEVRALKETIRKVCSHPEKKMDTEDFGDPGFSCHDCGLGT